MSNLNDLIFLCKFCSSVFLDKKYSDLDENEQLSLTNKVKSLVQIINDIQMQDVIKTRFDELNKIL